MKQDPKITRDHFLQETRPLEDIIKTHKPSLLMLYCTCYLMHIQDQTSVKYIISIYSMSVRSIFAPCSSLFSSTVHYIVLLQYISVQSDCEQSYQWTDRLEIFGHLFGYLDIQVHQWLANCDIGWSKSAQDMVVYI